MSSNAFYEIIATCLSRGRDVYEEDNFASAKKMAKSLFHDRGWERVEVRLCEEGKHRQTVYFLH